MIRKAELGDAEAITACHRQAILGVDGKKMQVPRTDRHSPPPTA